MQNRDALLALADRVERETPSRELDAEIALVSGKYVREKRGRDRQEWFYPTDDRSYGRKALHYGSSGMTLECYTTSVDAALSLLPEGWVVASMEWWPMVANSSVTLREVSENEAGLGYDEGSGDARATAATPAQALLAAILRAKAGE